MFYVDVRSDLGDAFYYNMVAEVNKGVVDLFNKSTYRPVSSAKFLGGGVKLFKTNKHVSNIAKALLYDRLNRKPDSIADRPISDSAKHYINNRLAGNLGKTGPLEFGMIGIRNKNTGRVEYASALDMAGISATVSYDLASKILERAIYYCPKDTGTLASSGRIEQMPDGSCRIFFDCPYAFYVHEYTWKYHKPPTCAKFLTIAINDFEGVS